MFFMISKILAFLADPMTWFLALFFVGLFRLLKLGRGKKCLLGSAVLIFLLTNPFLSNMAIRFWEPDTYAIDSISQPYEVGILLSGATRGLDHIAKRPLYGPGADRVLQTIQLYKQGKIKRILLTGGSGSVEFPEQKESYWIMKVLHDAGIPDSAVVVEGESRNTRENALFSARVISQNPKLHGRILVITSAFHMRRAEACFKKVGLQFDTFPVDSGKSILSMNPYRILVPDAHGVLFWDQMIREWTGLFAYYVMDYI
jgi:uncharacterized SAM-binding protein YcdF (DUF218 family)